MPKLIAISGSLRKASFNTSLLRAAAEVAPPGCTIEIASIAGIPLYDGDVEAASGIPREVAALKDEIAQSDGVLLASPEYNNSIPGVLKNAIDWCSRPPADIPRVFGDRPVALIGATPGMGGTRLAQSAWLPVFRTLGMRPYSGRTLYVAGAGKAFDADGALVDATVRKILTELVAGFASFAAR